MDPCKQTEDLVAHTVDNSFPSSPSFLSVNKFKNYCAVVWKLLLINIIRHLCVEYDDGITYNQNLQNVAVYAISKLFSKELLYKI